MRRVLICAAVVALPLIAVSASPADAAGPAGGLSGIQHLVVIFQENISFDHYFATYPRAANPPGEPEFVPAKDTRTGRIAASCSIRRASMSDACIRERSATPSASQAKDIRRLQT